MIRNRPSEHPKHILDAAHSSIFVLDLGAQKSGVGRNESWARNDTSVWCIAGVRPQVQETEDQKGAHHASAGTCSPGSYWQRVIRLLIEAEFHLQVKNQQSHAFAMLPLHRSLFPTQYRTVHSGKMYFRWGTCRGGDFEGEFSFSRGHRISKTKLQRQKSADKSKCKMKWAEAGGKISRQTGVVAAKDMQHIHLLHP